MDERPAPVVTISDPTRPGEPVDVMVSGTEKEPWRPQRKHWTALGLLGLIAVAAVVPDRVVSARAEERRADRAAVDGVRVSMSVGADVTSGASPEGVLPVVVSNDGPTPVTLLEVQVDGYEVVRLDKDVKSIAGTQVELTDTATCGERLVAPGSENRARVKVRTPGGSVVTRRIPVPNEVWGPLNSLAQVRCGYRPALDVLRVSATGTRRGRVYEVRRTARNTGRLPLSLGYVDAGPGLTADLRESDGEPLAPGARRELVYTVSVQSCSDARSSIGFPEGTAQLLLSVATVLSDSSSSGDGATMSLLDADLDGSLSQSYARWFDGRCPA